ncbi:uncharacterized protein HMPREF1541_06170 [Cyphellophora europaea CBS 101466]|uniref:Uncharacterized protein n=1 Tax=Cyphellophora europaea (strain CBS 101466) TaxID=1220924 RepID=W2RW11_CYPE1|nr:uncharacterized protein HMPREF1541_06170 [Cyphellophora europaea CBS 101466]ETN39943.1 hypothetical protein HMPREF1541_06170 [Cyphellophora europaea CBS 101466]
MRTAVIFARHNGGCGAGHCKSYWHQRPSFSWIRIGNSSVLDQA